MISLSTDFTDYWNVDESFSRIVIEGQSAAIKITFTRVDFNALIGLYDRLYVSIANGQLSVLHEINTEKMGELILVS